MRIDIYPSATRQSKYLAVPAGTDFDKWQASADGFDKDLLSLQPLFKTIDVERDTHLIGINCDRVIREITAKGWSVVQVEVKFDVKVG